MYVTKMKPIIIEAMKYTLVNIETKTGYDKDDVLLITFKDIGVAIKIRDYARGLGAEATVKQETSQLVCVFIHTTDVYKLKG